MDAAGFEAFVLAHQNSVYGAALRLTGQAVDAEDIAQEVFIRAYRALSVWDAERARALRARPWLARIVLNVCRNRARAARRRPRTVPLGDTDPELPREHDGDDAWAARLRAIPAANARAIVLHHVMDLPYAEVAEVLGVAEGTAKARVRRGLAELRSLVPKKESP